VLKEVDEDVIGTEEREGRSTLHIISLQAPVYAMITIYRVPHRQPAVTASALLCFATLCYALGDLSQEKSRIGLGEVYAEDFLATATSGKSGAKEAKDNAVRDELKELYHKVHNSAVQ
jgi:hypothetical protein